MSQGKAVVSALCLYVGGLLIGKYNYFGGIWLGAIVLCMIGAYLIVQLAEEAQKATSVSEVSK